VPESIPHPDYAADGVPRSKFLGRNNITILDKKGQDAMRKVCRLAREVLDIAAREIKPGVTTDYIDSVVHKACIERNVRSPSPSTVNLLANVSILSSHTHPH
jgi:methionyl aminopeptidase